ncbi:hypothetical protein NUW58_g4021 [Xylaria curta]|uniref:Uncharacterized protein n=1 Tax=Xylaria curta TaxID=42375 RepID=A0ACC1P8D0_9PEZI|nr:hypothetical protein NUW58_g4021 [Xylaria curta]
MAAAAKASVGDTPSNDNDKPQTAHIARLVVVVLRSRGPYSIPRRRLVFSPSRPSMSIGRSSKVHTKGYIPAIDNAWFENPVMSRQHAKLFANFDNNPPVIYITDEKSFHGTFISTISGSYNQEKIANNEPFKLTHGDTIRFGIDILRCDKTYPPCTVDFFIEKIAQKPDDPPQRGFTVPDEVDDEDEDHEDCEDSNDLTMAAVRSRPAQDDFEASVVANGRCVDHTNPYIILPPRAAKFSTAGSSVCGNASTIVIDSLSESTTHPSNTEQSTADPDTPRPCEFDNSSQAPAHLDLESHTSLQTLLVSSDDEGMFVYRDDSSNEDSDMESEEDWQSESDVSLATTEELSELADLDDPSQTHDDISIVEDQRDFFLGYEEDLDDDLSIEPYYEESVQSFDPDEEEDDNEATKGLSNDQPRVQSPVPLSTKTDQPFHYGTMPSAPPFDHHPLLLSAYENSHNRDPSPSDAALFKCRPLLDTSSSDIRAQKLGERSGKFEFFEAREKNRAAIEQHECTVTSSAGKDGLLDIQSDGGASVAVAVHTTSRSPSPSLSCAEETTALPKVTEDNVPQRSPEVPDTSSIKLGDDDTNQYSAWTASGYRFINNPTNNCLNELPLARRTEPDMTSAYSFQRSMRAMKVETTSGTRRLPIQDLLAQEPKQFQIVSQRPPELIASNDLPASSSSTPTKRPYEEAFDQGDDSTTSRCAGRIIAHCSPRIAKAKDQETRHDNVHIPVTQEKLAALGVTDQDIPTEPTVVFVQPEAPRPAKKMRLATVAAQVVACVALGSAATFSYLVNTAPVF